MPADKAFYYRDFSLVIPEGVYEPKEDSLLLAENLEVKPGDVVLDVGTGSGLQALMAAGKASRVLAVDINPLALVTAKGNAKRNKARNIEFRLSDLLSGVKPSERFDLIVFNPPYIPSGEEDMESKAWAGGKKGRKTIDRFMNEAPKHLKIGGRILLLVSSLNEPEDIIRKLEKGGLRAQTKARMKLWFEELLLLEVFYPFSNNIRK